MNVAIYLTGKNFEKLNFFFYVLPKAFKFSSIFKFQLHFYVAGVQRKENFISLIIKFR